MVFLERCYGVNPIMVWLAIVAFMVMCQTSMAHNHHHHHHGHDHDHDDSYPSLQFNPLALDPVGNNSNQTGTHRDHRHHIGSSFFVNVSKGLHQMPPDLFGIFFEEINHAGVGGLWSELVNNRGFEAGGRHSPSIINPWMVIGDEKEISINTELSSCFATNPVALQMDVHCDPTTCPPGGVGIYNPGFWGMNIKQGVTYNVIFYIKSTGPLDIFLSLVSQDAAQVLAFKRITADAEKVKNWTKMEATLQAKESHQRSRLQITTSQKGTIWLDQVSAMPNNTYLGHGFRTGLMEMLKTLKPRFLRFPGGCYVEGTFVRNAFRWKETVGPWEERPGHFGDTWLYWSDDGLGFLEYLQLAEDLGTEPVWVVHSGMGIKEQIDSYLVAPFVQEMLDGIEFARGSANSTWGSLRAKLGHPEPFSLKYIAVGNEACQIQGFNGYKSIYLKFYKALRENYPDIKIISNCDASKKPLNHPADLYDFHNYTTAEGMLELTHRFKKVRREPNAAKAFVSEYAVTEPASEARNGSFKGALAEAAFLLSLEQNSDIVSMISYAPLFANVRDRFWNPDSIFFNSEAVYGISSYWVQTFFTQSSGATLLNIHFQNDSLPNNTYASAIRWTNATEKIDYVTIKVVNYNNVKLNLKVTFDGVDANKIQLWKQTVLTTDDIEDDNSFDNPTKVVPISTFFKGAVGKAIYVTVQPYSLTAYDLKINT